MNGFGKLPSGKRKERIEASPHYRDGAFHNIAPTAMMSEDASYGKMLREYFKKRPGHRPSFPLPVMPLDATLYAGAGYTEASYAGVPHAGAAENQPVITWFGHSSYLIGIGGLNLLVDPVFSPRASFSSLVGPKAFSYSQSLDIKDLPVIDAVIITHDHFDHLDDRVIRELKESVKAFYAPLGVGSHLTAWGVPEHKIIELDWWESVGLPCELRLHAVPARHFSGRTLRRNQTLWAAYVLESPAGGLFLGGDSGYGEHFKEIGAQYGPFEVVILENGQYNTQWPHIHMQPEETVQAAIDLKGKLLLPVHWGKFKLAFHDWDEPITRLLAKAAKLGVEVATPRIGEALILGETSPKEAWWREK